LVDFIETVEALKNTSMRMDQDLVDEVITQYRRALRRKKG
jgi:hypothetical protein